MIDAGLVAFGFACCAALFAYLAHRFRRASMHLSILNQCISDMLQQPRAAEAIAKATMARLIDEGYVKPWRP